ncbi:DUF3732 domain-containing protein [Poseidonibacter ostreae]|uniref:DUF3732 domain-containing protein n=1 Tax=Poseidonibacter ostreae TaxID=2654171 RepID=A0A6L4WTI3_9BACT|nr:DUF3732 domain-containing protein [Poseidonibacter ostreae]KAB7889545.1 DUF3732 domain-containing protein [Poseidonibacter ostreae]
MRFKIHEIGLFNTETVDVIEFRDGVNIVSGTSKTGKSSIGKIINYCLAASKNIIPEGIIRRNTEIYSMLVTIDDNLILIARNKYKAETLSGEKYLFIEPINTNLSLKELSYSYFFKNDNKFITISDFLELEIIKYFPSFPPKTRQDGREYVRPSIRNMTPFIFQNQNIICNESTLFFDMDNHLKQRGIIRDFELFLGLVNNNIYNKINRKNELTKLIKKLQNKQEIYKDELENEIKKLKGHYNRLYSHFNVEINLTETPLDELKDVDILNSLNINYNINSDSIKRYQETKELCNIRSRVIEKLKIEYSNIKNQINNINKTSLSLSSLVQSCESNSKCPLCDSSTEKHFQPFIDAKKVIIKEQSFLNNYNKDILNDKLEARKDELNSATKDFEILLEQLNILKDDITEIKSMEESIALQNEIKGIIKASIKNIEKYEKLNDNSKELDIYQDELDKLIKELGKINLKRKIQEAENKISEYATQVLTKLPFGTEDYGQANLKFTIKDISFYQQQVNSILYMNEIGSAENHLSLHLAVILGLHRFIQNNKDSILPSLVFIDQPSQVYFPEDSEFLEKEEDGDIIKVKDIYKVIIDFIDEWNKDNDTKIQIIIVDHFYSKEDWFQERLLEPRWDKDKAIGLVKKLIAVK